MGMEHYMSLLLPAFYRALLLFLLFLLLLCRFGLVV